MYRVMDRDGQRWIEMDTGIIWKLGTGGLHSWTYPQAAGANGHQRTHFDNGSFLPWTMWTIQALGHSSDQSATWLWLWLQASLVALFAALPASHFWHPDQLDVDTQLTFFYRGMDGQKPRILRRTSFKMVISKWMFIPKQSQTNRIWGALGHQSMSYMTCIAFISGFRLGFTAWITTIHHIKLVLYPMKQYKSMNYLPYYTEQYTIYTQYGWWNPMNISLISISHERRCRLTAEASLGVSDLGARSARDRRRPWVAPWTSPLDAKLGSPWHWAIR